MTQLSNDEYERLGEAVSREMKGSREPTMREWEVWEENYLKRHAKGQSLSDMALFLGKPEVLVKIKVESMGLKTF